MKCKSCNFETNNKKSISNHLRYGCQFAELGYYPEIKERKKLENDKDWTNNGEKRRKKQREYLVSSAGKRMMSKRNKKFAKNNPDKKSVYHKVWYAKKTMKLEIKPCEICGSKDAQAHHPDYSKPLKVVWLCLKHHRIRENVWKGIYATR